MIVADTLTELDRRTITDTTAEWAAALNRGSLDGVMAHTAADVLVFPAHEAPISGFDALREWHERWFKEVQYTIKPTTDEIIGSPAAAVHRWTFTMRVQPHAGGAPIDDSGTCFWIWRREADGRWLVARAIWNSRHPMPS
jgi:ketosteroid isomerase-like protein